MENESVLALLFSFISVVLLFLMEMHSAEIIAACSAERANERAKRDETR